MSSRCPGASPPAPALSMRLRPPFSHESAKISVMTMFPALQMLSCKQPDALGFPVRRRPRAFCKCGRSFSRLSQPSINAQQRQPTAPAGLTGRRVCSRAVSVPSMDVSPRHIGSICPDTKLHSPRRVRSATISESSGNIASTVTRREQVPPAPLVSSPPSLMVSSLTVDSYAVPTTSTPSTHRRMHGRRGC